MSNSTQLYSQVFGYLRQYTGYCDLRHLKTLAWMISALICSGQLSLSAWEPYVQSSAQQAQSFERRWRRFLETFGFRERDEDKRQAFVAQLSTLPPEKIVYLDESGMDSRSGV